MNIADLKRLAGIDKEQNDSSMGENISHTATALRQKERKLGLKPGDPDWFKLWFSIVVFQTLYDWTCTV